MTSGDDESCWLAVGEGVDGVGGLWEDERSPGAEARASDDDEGGGGGVVSFFTTGEVEAAFGDSSSSASAAVPREKSSNEGVWVSLPPGGRDVWGRGRGGRKLRGKRGGGG